MVNRDDLKRVIGTEDPLMIKLLGGSVLRYHTHGNQSLLQSVADHTWRVQVILLHLWPDASRDLLMAALYHDVAECFTGDIPAPVKRMPGIMEEIKKLEKELDTLLGVNINLSLAEGLRLKVADKLELLRWCRMHNHSQESDRIIRVGIEYVSWYSMNLPTDDVERISAVLEQLIS